jgi:hypothetical protein
MTRTGEYRAVDIPGPGGALLPLVEEIRDHLTKSDVLILD